MPHPGAFKGSRKDFMLSQKPFYRTAVLQGFVKDAISIIQNRYFKRYPIDLPHDEEPTPEHLQGVDDDTPEKDEPVPDKETLGAVEYEKAMQELAVKGVLIVKRKKQIKRWLEHQHMKDNDVDPMESGALNPFNILLFQLTGVGHQKPRLRTPMNVWRRSHRAEIEEEAKALAAKDTRSQRKKLANIRERVAKDMFEKLSKEDRAYYKDLAKDEHDEAVAKWERDTTSPPSTSPEDRQKAIQGLTRFVQPILDGICAATGWKASLSVGGPEPANSGRFRLVTVNSGTTRGSVKMNFTRSEAVGYHKHVVPLFGEFLRKCYSVEECKSRSLDAIDGFETIDQVLQESDDAEATDLGFLDKPSSLPSAPTSRVPSGGSEITPPAPSNALTSKGAPSAAKHVTTPAACTSTAVDDDATSNSGDSIVANLANVTSRTPSPAPPHSPHHPQSRVATPDFVLPSRSPTPTPAVPSPIPLHSPSSAPSFTPRAVSQLTPMEVDDVQLPRPLETPVTAAPPATMHPTTAVNSVLGPTAVNSAPAATMGNVDAPKPSKKRAITVDFQDPDALTSRKKPRSATSSPSDKTKTAPAPKPLPRPKPRPLKPVSRAVAAAISKDYDPRPLRSLPPVAAVPSTSKSTSLAAIPTPLPISTAKDPGSSVSAPVPSTSKAPCLPPASNHPSLPPTPTPSHPHGVQTATNPIKLPIWYQNAMNQFTICPTVINNTTVQSLGAVWSDFIKSWCDFETKLRFGEDAKYHKAKLSAKNRPKVVGDWIARARSSTFQPKIGDLVVYRESFWSWWTSLQPQWRMVNGEIVAESLEGDWSVLQIPGINGLVSVVTALLYWGLHAHGSKTHTKEWGKAVLECTKVFLALCSA